MNFIRHGCKQKIGCSMFKCRPIHNNKLSNFSVKFWYGKVGSRKSVVILGAVALTTATAYTYLSNYNILPNEWCSLVNAQEGGETKEILDLDPPVFKCLSDGENISLKEAIHRSLDHLQKIKDESGSPGIAVSVSVDGQEVWSQGLGYADLENRVPCKPETVFRIASISKAITSAVAAKLVEKGSLDLDVPIHKYLPSYPEKEVDGEKVTITTRQLLSHLSGIRHYHNNVKEKSETKGPVPQKKNEFYSKKHYDSVEKGLDMYKDDPLEHKPGSKFLYTTFGFSTLSAVMEKVAKKPFEKLMEDSFKEFGMDSTYLERHEPIIYNRGRHYQKNKKGKIINSPYVDLSCKWAGGGFLSTTKDLIRFGNIMLYSYQQQGPTPAGPTKPQACCQGDMQGEARAQEIQNKDTSASVVNIPGYLRPETIREFWQATEPSENKVMASGYGLGWFVGLDSFEYGYGRWAEFHAGHSGGAVGCSSNLLIVPRSRSSVIPCLPGSRTTCVCDKGEKPCTCMCNSVSGSCDYSIRGHSSGIVVAVIVNMFGVGLEKTSRDIAKEFSKVHY